VLRRIACENLAKTAALYPEFTPNSPILALVAAPGFPLVFLAAGKLPRLHARRRRGSKDAREIIG
jgi:hypothetical protein